MEKASFKINVGQDDEGQRLDKFLVKILSKKFSRSFIQKLISSGSILLNGEPVKSHYKVKSGDVLGVIANRFHVRISQLQDWNNFQSLLGSLRCVRA